MPKPHNANTSHAIFMAEIRSLANGKTAPIPALRLEYLRESHYAPVGQAIGICLGAEQSAAPRELLIADLALLHS
jgi:hypothetical protein